MQKDVGLQVWDKVTGWSGKWKQDIQSASIDIDIIIDG